MNPKPQLGGRLGPFLGVAAGAVAEPRLWRELRYQERVGADVLELNTGNVGTKVEHRHRAVRGCLHCRDAEGGTGRLMPDADTELPRWSAGDIISSKPLGYLPRSCAARTSAARA